MTEFTGLDMEMTFMDDYHEVLNVLEGLFLSIFEGINQRCPKEIEAVRAQYPFADLKFGKPGAPEHWLRYPEAVALLREHGPGWAEKRAETCLKRGRAVAVTRTISAATLVY